MNSTCSKVASDGTNANMETDLTDESSRRLTLKVTNTAKHVLPLSTASTALSTLGFALCAH